MPTKKPGTTPANQQKGKKVCTCCHHEKRLVDGFYISKSPLFSIDGRLPVCKDCIADMCVDSDTGEINEVELNKCLRKFDKPYYKNDLMSAYEQFEREHAFIDKENIKKYGRDIIKLLLRSQPGLKPERNQSHNNMITNYQKKGKGYWGAGAERNTFQILFNIIKGATKNSQSLFQGCTSYNFQYSASIQSADAHTYFPVTNAQAQDVLVGSYVSVGYGELKTDTNTVNNDRGVGTIHKYADDVKVLRIETLDENNKAVYLDIKTGFNTTPIKLSDTVNAPITISSMHWWSGTTNTVIGRHDGSPVSNTDGKHPYRVQGREYAVGGYMVASDTVMDFQSDYSKKVYIAPKGLAHSSSDATIRNKYTCIGTISANPDGKGSDYWIGDISVDVNTGGWFPSAKGSSNSQGWADMLYAGGATTSGTREYLMGGVLGDGSGAAGLRAGSWISWGHWYGLGAD